ncbi:MAG TPA: 3-phosphoshikimate 1-carboxyvinyltransferase [Thermotogota bacterium]|nr:3-phosphoshikimate 1-carboxyvinyltransferase [Thermotogota bacterium]
MRVLPGSRIRGTLQVPPDKSLSHRCLILGSLAEGKSVFWNLLPSADVASTRRVLKACGGNMTGDWNRMEVSRATFDKVEAHLDCGNSGTTVRLLSGVMASFANRFGLQGDASLSRRPMARIAVPLAKMGARFFDPSGKLLDPAAAQLPFSIQGSGKLQGIRWHNEKRSAQVKSALLLAGLRSEGGTTVVEPVGSRDHTERLLQMMGALLSLHGNEVHLEPSILSPLEFSVPGDFSSASFFLALAACHPNASLSLEGVNLNPTRTGFLQVLRQAGATIACTEQNGETEPRGSLQVHSGKMQGICISSDQVPSMVDEIPLVALLGVFAQGKTEVKGAGELRVKESDRITVLVQGLRNLGVEIHETDDGFWLEGPQAIRGGTADACGDHRMAMLFSLCGCLSREGVWVEGADSVSISYPSFFTHLEQICSGRG